VRDSARFSTAQDIAGCIAGPEKYCNALVVTEEWWEGKGEETDSNQQSAVSDQGFNSMPMEGGWEHVKAPLALTGQ
jgi:hypothetical protein